MSALSRVVAAILMIVFARRSQQDRGESLAFTTRGERARAPIVRFIVKHPFATIGALSGFGIVVGALVMISGVIPIKASSGHWAITAVLLDFAKRRSVATYSLAITSPPLDHEALIVHGAAHYVSGCEPCHGGPDGRIPPVMRAMTPPPPALTTSVSRYNARELFTIIKHGIKFTGMPAWPAQQRDDEVWAAVAFVQRLPQLSAAEYHRLAYGDADVVSRGDSSPAAPAPELARQICGRCHGADGVGRDGGAFPSLAGQQPAYLEASLRAFADGRRFSGVMTPVATRLTDAMMRELAQYYASLPVRRPSAADPPRVAVGESIAAQGVGQRGIPACRECHGAIEPPKNPLYPRLAGQHAPYLAKQLQLLQRRQRGGSPQVNLMHAFVDRLEPDDIEAVTAYFSSRQR